MLFSRRAIACIAFALFVPFVARAASTRSAPTRPKAAAEPTYKSAIVIDAATGKVLFEDNPDNVSPPASMTKLMTYAVLHDLLTRGTVTLATPVKIDVSDSKMAGTQVFLDPRETFTVEELVYAMMIQSANDAAHALARASAGSVPAFVELMNAKARALGMKNTTFRSPHGLPPTGRRVQDGDLTTPRDFALLSQHLIRNTDVLKYTAISKRDFAPERAKGPFKMENHNKLVGKVAGVDGLKTGFTDAAGYCLSATAQRNGRRVILVIMGSLGPGGQRDLGRSRDRKAIELLEKGFAALTAVAPGSAGAATTKIPATKTSPIATAQVPATTPPALVDTPIKPAPKPATPAPGAATPPAPPSGESAPIRFTIPKR